MHDWFVVSNLFEASLDHRLSHFAVKSHKVKWRRFQPSFETRLGSHFNIEIF